MSTVGIIRNLKICVLTQLRPELLRVHLLLLYNCTDWMSIQSICPSYSTGVVTILRVACCLCRTLYIVSLYLYFFVHVRSTSQQRGSLIIGSFIYSGANCSQPRCTPALVLCCRLSMVAVLVAANTIASQGSFIYPTALAIVPWYLRSRIRLPTAPTMYVCTIT